MSITTKVALVLLLTTYPLYGQSMESVPPTPVTPAYDQPESRMATEPVPRTTDPNLVPANRNPYFDDPSTHVEGVPTGNPEPSGVFNPTANTVSGPVSDPDSGAAGFSGGISRSGTDGIRGSGD